MTLLRKEYECFLLPNVTLVVRDIWRLSLCWENIGATNYACKWKQSGKNAVSADKENKLSSILDESRAKQWRDGKLCFAENGKYDEDLKWHCVTFLTMSILVSRFLVVFSLLWMAQLEKAFKLEFHEKGKHQTMKLKASELRNLISETSLEI